MNEGRQITKEQAEACMAQDWRFEVIPQPNRAQFRVKDGVMQVWCLGKGPWRDNDYYEAITDFPSPHIHADPNNTFERLFGSERELTFEEVGAALFRGNWVWATVPWTGQKWVLRLSNNKFDLSIEFSTSGKVWCTGFSYNKDWEYTLYKEPTQPEPLTLEALEARVKALEEKK